MPVETNDDRAAFVDPDDFGVAVTWIREGVAQTPFAANFHRPARMVDGLSDTTFIDRDAFLHCAEASLPVGAAEHDAVSIEGESQAFRCKALRPDGTGFVIVDLKKA